MERPEPTETQARAIRLRGRDILVTAGAGSGKTHTLVERYLSLLEEGSSPQRVVAITFTDKAARGMRNRVRAAVRQRLERAGKADERQHWTEVMAKMDAARIGTIHSLCAEILRAHPAEAEVDPEFAVIDEGLSATLRARAVEDAVVWATDAPTVAQVFREFTPSALTRLLSFLLARRLDATAVLADADMPNGGEEALRLPLAAYIAEPAVSAAIAELQEMQSSGDLMGDAGDKLAQQLDALLSGWRQVEAAFQNHNHVEAACLLFPLRREKMTLQAGKKKSRAKDLLRRLQQFYDDRLDPWLGGRRSQDTPPELACEVRATEMLAQLKAIFIQAQTEYRSSLDQRYALDFDDLEAKAADLLAIPAIQKRWQEAVSAVLVDEFQDTNRRQQAIVRALCGEPPGRLFVVGDARQSIYRFRGADVSVFRHTQREVESRGGETLELDLTFRAHSRLTRAFDSLLAPIMGTEEDPERPYSVPFSSLRAHRTDPQEQTDPPYVEIALGTGETAATARPHAAQALVHRLVELRQAGQIRQWDDVALLFRASTGFQAYEDALETWGVPFVTVAGRGFYDRPEIRDVLNMLKALADPWDDLALTGLLRSPAFGLTDAALYRLRWRNDAVQPLHTALRDDLSHLDGQDQERALRASQIIEALSPLVDRLPVAELLKRVIDATDYRAVLASSHSRLWRNLDKLLADAHASGLVRVREFLAYLQTLNEVGVREGEAPVEAQGSVRLMTVHKAKGLEFEFVVIADAARTTAGHRDVAYLLPEIGLAVQPDQMDGSPLLFRLARWYDAQQRQAEENRLLYVAATRAKEKLLISGHLTRPKDRWKADGWLKMLLEAAGVDIKPLMAEAGIWHDRPLDSGESIGIWVAPEEMAGAVADVDGETAWPISKAKPLYPPVLEQPVEQMESDQDEAPERAWRATGDRIRAPAAAVGRMVHAAIERWLFPEDVRLDALLETTALNEGLVDPQQRQQAIRETKKLLARLQDHPLWAEINGAQERHHEVPYTWRAAGEKTDSGKIDLLFRIGGNWQLVDFKTDELGDEGALERAVAEHRPQIERYARAIWRLLRCEPAATFCFLDYQGHVHLESV